MINNNLNHDFFLKDLGHSNYSDSIQIPRHRWYYFKEGFSPILVEKAIQDTQCNENDIIMDPFAGSGTVPLVATTNGLNGIGFEVNPFLVFLGKTKLIQVKTNIIHNTIERIKKGISLGKDSPLAGYSTFSENNNKKKWLFNKSILNAFEGGWNKTLELDKDIRNIYQLALLHAAMETCNATRDGKCLRYRKDWQTLNFNKDKFLNHFLLEMDIIKQDLELNPIFTNKGRIISGDSRINVKYRFPWKFKLCVTSPPYLNSFDYSDIYRPELFLGKFVNSNTDLNKIRHKTVRSHMQVAWEEPCKNDFGILYDETINQINKKRQVLWNNKIPLMIQAYFEDISNLLRTLRTKANIDASLWLVVSTSAYAGVEIPVDLIIADIGIKTGWFLREIGVLRYLRTSNQFSSYSDETNNKKLRESVVIFNVSNK